MVNGNVSVIAATWCPPESPGLQGPIDDAFCTPFLCVRGTGKPWNSEVNAWALASLRRFEYEWARYMRGDLPVRNDTEVTEADVRDKHLILFRRSRQQLVDRQGFAPSARELDAR